MPPGMPNMPGGPGMPGGPNMPGGMAMRGGRMPPQLNRFQPMEPPPDEKKSSEKADKSLYREGDMIGSTGYKVKSIIMEENKVVLLQNGKETVLLLDEKNTNNSIRRETVKREELAVREKYKQQEEKDKNANQQANQNPNWQRPGFPNRFGPGGIRPGRAVHDHRHRPGPRRRRAQEHNDRE